MTTPHFDASAIARAGAEALRLGQAAMARELFGELTAAGRANAAVWLGLAQSQRLLGDAGASHAAVDRALELEPRNLQALVLKGDLLDEAGDVRRASSFYLAAVQGAPAPERLPAELRGVVKRAQDQCARYAARYEAFLRERLARGGESPRFAQSLDILFGKRHVYHQSPRYYYFPGLPQIQFYDRAAFPWLEAVEAATEGIREELLGVLGLEGAFKPYVVGDPKMARKDFSGMINNPAWSAYYLRKNGEVQTENAARCPRTLAALEGAPLAELPSRGPSVLFSLLKPGAHIPPHVGMVNTRLICHLPLIVPNGCRFRVGNEIREWTEGQAWVFDDSIEHEAWNPSAETRVVLIFDIWRPEIGLEERRFICAMFEAIDAHFGQAPNWEI